MENNIDILTELNKMNMIGQESTLTAQIIEHYKDVTLDYEHWSRCFNMHFGYYRRWNNIFNREKMLEQLNEEIVRRLQIDLQHEGFFVDLGCGVGAMARFIARNYSKSSVKGVTIVPWQIEKAVELTAQENLQERVNIIKGDFAALPFKTASVDGVWAIESACYAEGKSKEGLIKEISRVLKKGGRFVISDGFIKQPERNMDWLTKRCYRAICKNWVLPEMATVEFFVAALKAHGLINIVVEDVSWRIAPSVAHVPFAVTTFLLKNVLAGEKLKPQSLNNLKASLMPMILGLNRSKFSYYFISGVRS